MQKSIKLMIVEDHKMLRQGLVMFLKEYDFSVFYEADNGRHALELLKETQPDVILMDIQMPVMNGIEALQIIKKTYPEIKVIMITGLSDRMYEEESKKGGAELFLPKNCTADVLVDAIRAIHRNETYEYNKVHEPTPSLAAKPNPKILIRQKALTNKERNILLGICGGVTRKEMARKFNITTRTVRYHTYNIYSKTLLSDRLELIRYAVENGYLNQF